MQNDLIVPNVARRKKSLTFLGFCPTSNKNNVEVGKGRKLASNIVEVANTQPDHFESVNFKIQSLKFLKYFLILF